MLTNLLPGFRELRAPLAAGYLWLAAAWVLWTPTCKDSELTRSACRLDSLVSGLGFAAVASFAAYLLGGLSIAFCSWPLRRWLQGGGLHRDEHLRSVSARADRHLRRLATEGVERMSLALAFAESSVKDVLDDVLGEEAPPPSRLRWRAPRGVHAPAVLKADSPAPPPQEQVNRDRLGDAMARELDEIVVTRLLGRDPELFSAIDRRRAEVEFRLAVIPPLVVVLAALAADVPPLAAIALLAGALLFAAGLGWDALTSQRQANDELTVAIADGRVLSPALARAEAEANARAGRSRLDEMRAAAGHATNAMRDAILRAEELDSSPSRMYAAREAVRDAQGYLTRVESTFPAAVSELGARAVAATDRAVRLWETPDGRGDSNDWTADSRRLVGESKRLASDFRDAVLNELERATTSARPADRPTSAEAHDD